MSFYTSLIDEKAKFSNMSMTFGLLAFFLIGWNVSASVRGQARMDPAVVSPAVAPPVRGQYFPSEAFDPTDALRDKMIAQRLAMALEKINEPSIIALSGQQEETAFRLIRSGRLGGRVTLLRVIERHDKSALVYQKKLSSKGILISSRERVLSASDFERVLKTVREKTFGLRLPLLGGMSPLSEMSACGYWRELKTAFIISSAEKILIAELFLS